MTTVATGISYSVVTQLRVHPDNAQLLLEWLERVGDATARLPGFIEQTSLAPSPPVQLDWAISQRFADLDAASAWLQSSAWQQLAVEIRPALVGALDVHVIADSRAGTQTSPVLAVIYTQVPSEKMRQFVEWQQRIAAAEATFEGFRGYKLEPPIPGVQDEWVMLVRFDTDAHLEAWLNSDERQQLLSQALEIENQTHFRKVRGGFESWFASEGDTTAHLPPPWKQNMLVLLMLYPVAYLFGHFVGTPILIRHGVPVWGSVFIGNCFSVPLNGWVLVPQARKRFTWWLDPTRSTDAARNWAGALLIVALYGAWLLVFALLPI